MTELLPCPFCGSQEVVRLELDDEINHGLANLGGSVITCVKCGASSAVHFDRKENLVSSWNDRKPSDDENLRAALHDIIALDHHNHGPESRATKIARAALNIQQRASE